MNIKFLLGSSLLLLSSISMAQTPNNQILSDDHLVVCTFPCGAAEFQDALSELNSPSPEYAFGYIVNARTEQIKFLEVTRTVIDPFLDPFADPGFTGETLLSVNELAGDSEVINAIQIIIDGANVLLDLISFEASSLEGNPVGSAIDLFRGGAAGPANRAALRNYFTDEYNDTLSSITTAISGFIAGTVIGGNLGGLQISTVIGDLRKGQEITKTLEDGSTIMIKLSRAGATGVTVELILSTARFSTGEPIPQNGDTVPNFLGTQGGGLTGNEAEVFGGMLGTFNNFTFTNGGGGCSRVVIETTCSSDTGGGNKECDSVSRCSS